jgi:hypothetical protein
MVSNPNPNLSSGLEDPLEFGFEKNTLANLTKKPNSVLQTRGFYDTKTSVISVIFFYVE